MNRMVKLLMLFTIAILATGCGSHVMSEAALSTVDLPGGYSQFLKNPQENIGKTVLLAGYVVENQVSRDGTLLKIQPYTVDRQGQPRRLIQGGEEFLVRTDQVLPPEKFEAGHMVTLTGTYLGLESRGKDNQAYRRMLFEIDEIHSWPPPAHYPYGYRYPFRIY